MQQKGVRLAFSSILREVGFDNVPTKSYYLLKPSKAVTTMLMGEVLKLKQFPDLTNKLKFVSRPKQYFLVN